MAYTVLARRYRSGTFDEVIGQDHVAQTLKRAIQAGRVAHAYLFTGTRGVGKTSMARILAKALNCLAFDAPTVEPCSKCSSCVAIAKGEDIDVIEIDAASNTGVDNVRDLISNAQFRPARSRFKVYIIDEVHMLSRGAFNALLKIMEEPPEHVKFILATTEVDKVLPTILSRCQRYDFRNIPSREIVEHLRMIAREEQVNAEEDALQLVARAGAGSMRDSLSLLDRLLSVGEKRLTADMIEQLLGMPRAAAIFGLAQAIGTGDVKATLEAAGRIIDNGLSADTLIASLIEHFHNLLVLSACGMDSNLVDVVGVDAKELEGQARAFDPSALATNITILEELRRQMRSSQAGRAMLDATLARLAMSGEFSTIGEMVSRLNGNGTVPVRSGTSPPRVAAGSTTTPASPPRSTPSAEKKTAELSDGTADARRGQTSARGSDPRTPAAAAPGVAGSLASRGDASSLAPNNNPAPLAAPSTEQAPMQAPVRSGEAAGSMAPVAPVGPVALERGAASASSARPDVSVPVVDDAPDELPAVGKVAAEGATRSLWQAFKKSGGPRPPTRGVTDDAGPDNGSSSAPDEPAHLRDLRTHVLARLTPRLAAMFDGARLIDFDDATGLARLYFPAEAAGQAAFVKKNREQYALAFAEECGRAVSLEFEVEPEPVVAAAPVEQKSRVVRPDLDAVAAEAKDEPLTPMLDVDAVKDDPLVAAVLKAFDGSRIVKVE